MNLNKGYDELSYEIAFFTYAKSTFVCEFVKGIIWDYM